MKLCFQSVYLISSSFSSAQRRCVDSAEDWNLTHFAPTGEQFQEQRVTTFVRNCLKNKEMGWFAGSLKQ
ncbi:hypothetical protein MPL3356_150285 [Mesorhizobium plurifarium]|uniref:Uncharacterized protein n=1 Tax=Mesorhizobium plurifarium TaxID=69974 RepID=A0A090F502_MESPL|nr:hypothetical protein MPL3356_150285 [Mesorhizobium plurifarium]